MNSKFPLQFNIFLSISLSIYVAANFGAQSAALLNAVPISINTFPYLVSLTYSGYHICGGSIITARHILTAAHCVVNNQTKLLNNQMQVRAGSLDRTNPSAIYNVDNYMYHASYYPTWETPPFDIAVVKLSTRIIFNAYIQPIVMSRSEPPPDAIVTVAGWGKTHPNNEDCPIIAHAADFRSLSAQQCYQQWGTTFQEGEICVTSTTNIMSCHGDSGGPLVYLGQLVGVVSYAAKNCHYKTPAVLSSVSYHSRWIEAMVNFWLMS